MTSTSSRPISNPQPLRTNTMRAAQMTGPGKVQVMDTPLLKPGPGQVRIKLQGCGVCGSNIPVWEGRDWFKYPLEPGKPGHEGWGIVEAKGEGVHLVNVGQRVGLLSYNAFAEYDLADQNHVVPLPDSMHNVPFPAESLGCAVNVFSRSGITAGQRVAIVGFGFLGALIAQLAMAAGAQVVAISRREASLDMARTLGVTAVVPRGDIDTVTKAVASLNGGSLCDVVVEAAGAQASLDLAAELTKERGRLIIAGFHQDGPRTINAFLWNWRGLDVINAHERDPLRYIKGIRSAVNAVALGTLNPTPLYTHAYQLDRIADALTTAAERPDGFMKALIYMD